MTWKGREAKQIYNRAIVRAVTIGVEVLLTESNRTVPIEEATLERSGQTSVDRVKAEGAVSYDTPYARRQHEDLSLGHDAGRRGKWLEMTLKEQGPALRGVIADEIKRNVP